VASRRQGRENRSARNLPSFAEITDFLRSNPDSLGAREIARAFGLGPSELPGLRGMLRAIERSGELVRTGNRKFAPGRQLPDLLTVERFASDADGFPLVRPVADPDAGASADSPGFRLIGDAADELSVGERALVRLLRRDSGVIEAEIVRRLEPTRKRLVGVFRRTLDGGFVVPIDRRDRGEYRVLGHDAAGLPDDELVAAEEAPARRGQSRARIIERLGPASGAGAISRMMIAEFEIPAEFPPAALAEAAALPPFRIHGRADLRELALVTIDDTDARDFDDAVWAEPDPDPANPGGWHIVVAIADVAA
jgi:ribonuclease R